MVAGLKRLASVDIGTNSVLLLVAEKGPDGRLTPVREEAEITRLGRGVDRTGVLSPEGMEATLAVLARFAAEAREAGAERLVVTATSAARDARNGEEFLRGARERAGAAVEILSGEEEARLGYLAVAAEFADRAGPGGLLAIDVGGGSTEFVHGTRSSVRYRTSLDIGSVRLTERCIRSDPPSGAEQQEVRRAVDEALAALPAFPEAVTVVGVAGTVTSLFAIAHGIEPYDAARVHRGWLTGEEVALVRGRLCSLPLEERRRLPGIQPQRADVLPAGAILFEAALAWLGAPGAWVSDRGLRWGVLIDRWEALG
jgi:exopolyphosphatase/guanosine-5'-triphosphate,3'-diphosphate pyrophosphatase